MTTPANTSLVTPTTAGNYLYARLYQAVIRRAVEDLAQEEHQDQAREWLLSPESDYAFAAAGINADSLRQQVI